VGEITQSGVDATRGTEFLGFAALCKNPVLVHGVEADGTIQRMRRFINPILLWFARSNHDDLIRQGQVLHVEDADVPRPREFSTLPGGAKRVGRTLVSCALGPRD